MIVIIITTSSSRMYFSLQQTHPWTPPPSCLTATLWSIDLSPITPTESSSRYPGGCSSVLCTHRTPCIRPSPCRRTTHQIKRLNNYCLICCCGRSARGLITARLWWETKGVGAAHSPPCVVGPPGPQVTLTALQLALALMGANDSLAGSATFTVDPR